MTRQQDSVAKERDGSAAPPPIKVGDLLYAVGTGPQVSQGTTKVQLYTAVVKSVQPESAGVDQGRGIFVIELGADRPTIGFPKWVYRSYDVGVSVYCSAYEALYAFVTQARRRRDNAERARLLADQEVKWAGAEINALTRSG